MSEIANILEGSIEQDENIARQFHKTPGTPIKAMHQTPRKSSRKRSLFQSNSPTKSDDLGAISPLSISSSNSCESSYSPCSPSNGKFTTPPRTPTGSQGRSSGRRSRVKSMLFPSLKLPSPKCRTIPSTPLQQSRVTTPSRSNKKKGSVETVEGTLRDMTPPKSCRKSIRLSNRLIEENDQDDSDSSQNIINSTPTRWRRSEKNTTKESKPEIKTISAEHFYGPPRVIDKIRKESSTYESELGRKRVRSLSLESVGSNRSFVSGSGVNKRRRTSDIFTKPRSSRQGRAKEHFPGVWHGIKKPKKKKLNNKSKKSMLSPRTRIMKMAQSEKSSKIEVRPKPLFESKPRKRIASRKNKNVEPDDEIIDSFPHHLIKRKCLPSTSHPSKDIKMNDSMVPNPDKKFMKYGVRKAVFTLNENIKLQFSEGQMKLQSPKKRRKLYSGKNDANFNFYDDDEKDEMKENIENILNKLDNDSDVMCEPKKKQSSSQETIKRITEDQLINILDSPNTKVNLVNATPSKVLTEIKNVTDYKLVNNLSLAISELDFETSELKDFSVEENQVVAKVKSDTTLEKTGSMLSLSTSILSSGGDISVDGCLQGRESMTDEPEDRKEKYFSLFYKENWNNRQKPVANEGTLAKNSVKKKCAKVPDDQYLLDAGQKSIGIVTCPKCGVMYQAGDFADEATHKNFHEHLPELRFPGWINERVVGRYPDGRVIMIVSADSKSWWHKVTKVVDIVDQELGFPEGSVNSLFYKTVYLFISEKAKQIVGCLIAEECKEAFKMFPPLEGVEIDSCSKDPSPCRVGISRIWTALNYRRQGVASRMIECLQRTFFFGEIVPIDSVAFSVPSPSGKLLAQKVTGKFDFLVYGFV